VNILTAFVNIIEKHTSVVGETFGSSNRINNVGEGLEIYIKDLFSNIQEDLSDKEKMFKYNEVFSFLGNKNNPPDIMLKNGDAIEVKKIQSRASQIALNSSYPKQYLKADSHFITNECREAEEWSEKDMLYIIGSLENKNEIRYLFFIYGDIYAASENVYKRIAGTIKDNVEQIPDIEFIETNELGKVHKVDPLGITNLRVRGMWHIENPVKVYDYLFDDIDNEDIFATALMKSEKYDSFPLTDRERIESVNSENFKLLDVRVKNPDNPAQLVDCKLLIVLK
jgi:hypothetical protein